MITDGVFLDLEFCGNAIYGYGCLQIENSKPIKEALVFDSEIIVPRSWLDQYGIWNF